MCFGHRIGMAIPLFLQSVRKLQERAASSSIDSGNAHEWHMNTSVSTQQMHSQICSDQCYGRHGLWSVGHQWWRISLLPCILNGSQWKRRKLGFNRRCCNTLGLGAHWSQWYLAKGAIIQVPFHSACQTLPFPMDTLPDFDVCTFICCRRKWSDEQHSPIQCKELHQDSVWSLSYSI